MKKQIALLLLLVTSLATTAQIERQKNTFYINISPLVTNIYNYKGNIDGGGSLKGKSSFNFNIEYGRELLEKLEVTVGAGYYYNKVRLKSAFNPEVETTTRTYTRNYLSVPVQIKYRFLEFMYVNAGGIYNIAIDDKEKFGSSLGILVGIGSEYDLADNLCLTLNPYFQVNDLRSGRHINFYNLGVKIGVGYRF